MPYRLAIIQSHPIQYFTPLFRYLSQNVDIDLTVYYCSRRGVEEFEDAEFGQKIKWDIPLLEGYNSKFLPNIGTGDKSTSTVSLINPSIVGELRRGGYDAVWVHGHHYFSDLIAIGAAKLLKIPVFMRCESHLELHRSTIKRVLRKPILSLLYRKFCRACLPIGTRNRNFYRFHGVGLHRLFLVPYAVDNQFFADSVRQVKGSQSEIKARLGVSADKPVLLSASKLSERKRPQDLLEAFRLLRQQGSDAALVFVGWGEEEESLRSCASQHNIPDVCFLGFRNQSELPSIYAI